MRKPVGVAYAVLGTLPQAAGYVGVPLLVARRGRRFGWRDRRPGPVNVVGAVPILAGSGLIGWAVASHYSASPDHATVTIVPDYLVETGAYAISRNPLYVGGAAMWTGWAFLLGSPRVGLAGGTWFAALATIGVPFEERLLQKRFGDRYQAYQNRVGRWIRPTANRMITWASSGRCGCLLDR